MKPELSEEHRVTRSLGDCYLEIRRLTRLAERRGWATEQEKSSIAALRKRITELKRGEAP